MKRTILHSIAAAVVVAMALMIAVGTAAANSITVYSTGQDATAGRDNQYKITSDTTGEIVAPAQAFVVTSVANGWTSVSGASWIAPAADQSNGTQGGAPIADTTYETKFDLTGFDPATAVLNLSIAADDWVDISLNGVNVFSHPNTAMYFGTVSAVINSNFVAGVNTLDFFVHSIGGPSGLDVNITGTADPVPEPASLMLLGTGMAAVSSRLRRRK